jgi:phosphomannomutase
MRLMIKFGTGGWRAIIGDEFIKSNIELLAQSLADEINDDKNGKEIVISYDRRFLSREAATWISQVLTANEIKVYFINSVCPTPMTMFTVREMGVDFGIAVTASHNAALYNGVKIILKGGRDASIEFTDKLEVRMTRIDAIKSISCEEAKDKGLIEYINPENQYIDGILSCIDVDAIKRKNLKVVVDPMHGVSAKYLQTILNIVRCECKLIHDWHDTLFGKRVPSPTLESLGRLKYHVLSGDYDLGIGSDGDGDRLAVFDENGEFIHPNMILSLLYYYLLEYKGMVGSVVRNMSTTHLLDKIAASYGQIAYEVPVGFKHISNGMEQHNCVIGGESSGGLTIAGHIRGKDAIFATALFLEMISIIDKPVSELIKNLENKYCKHFFRENNISLDKSMKERLKDLIFNQKALPGFDYEVEKTDYSDGLKIYFKNSWLTCRFSGTEPMVRIFVESIDEYELENIEAKFKEFISN